MEGDSNQDGETRIRAGQASVNSGRPGEREFSLVQRVTYRSRSFAPLYSMLAVGEGGCWALLTRRNSHGRNRPKQVLISLFLAYTNFCYTSRGRWARNIVIH